MTTFIRPRLRKQAVTALAGLLFALAWLVRGGPLWWVSILAVIATVVRVASLYRMGGEDTDEGALVGSRADERQKVVGLHSRALACHFATVTAFVGLTAAIAVRGKWWSPFLIILAVTGFGYLFGLSSYGSGEPDSDDDADVGAQRSPLQR
jgi:hypothetical protein